MIETIYSDPNFLEHHGVKGMKWGVRRYQRKDGSLTPYGRKVAEAELKTLREKSRTSGNTHSKYLYNYVDKNIGFDNVTKVTGDTDFKEGMRTIGRDLYTSDSYYKKLYDQYEFDLAEENEFFKKYSEAINKGKHFIDNFA